MAESGGQVEDKNLIVTCGRTTNSGALVDEGEVRTRLPGNWEARLYCRLPVPQKLEGGKESRGCMQSLGIHRVQEESEKPVCWFHLLL